MMKLVSSMLISGRDNYSNNQQPINFSSSEPSSIQIDPVRGEDSSDSSNTSITNSINSQSPTNPNFLPRRFRRIILRNLIADPTVEYNDPIFNKFSNPNLKHNQELLSRSNSKIIDIIVKNNINWNKYYQIHQQLQRQNMLDLQQKQSQNYYYDEDDDDEVEEEDEEEEEEDDDNDNDNDFLSSRNGKNAKKTRGRKRKYPSNLKSSKKSKLNQFDNDWDDNGIDNDIDDDNSSSNFVDSNSSFQSLPLLNPSDFSKPIRLTREQIQQIQHQQNQRSSNYYEVPQLNFEWNNAPIKKSKKISTNDTIKNNNLDQILGNNIITTDDNDLKKINFDKNHINSTNKVAFQANKAYAANAAKYISSNNNDRILKLYGQIDASGNGWVDMHNNKIKLEKILLDKFSKSEIEKISCETEDNTCQVCNQKLNNYWEYVQHIDLHNRAIPDYHFKHVHFCPVDICPMTMIGFSKKRDLRHHIHNYHFYRSNIVEKYKPWESVMRELSYNCIWTGCASSFCRKDVLTRHIKLNHEKAADVKPGECYNCHTLKTSLWYKDPDGETICNACYQFQRKYLKPRPGVDRRLNATEGKKLVNIGPKDFKRVFGVEPN
jgi:hypothetical protein